ncbi:gamma-glutamyltransferase family protein [Mycolicibacterium thermoresistibile]
MRILRSARTVTAILAGGALMLAGCAGGGSRPAAAASVPCDIISNGTPVPHTPVAPPPPVAERDLATHPEIAIGYRKNMTAVYTARYSVVTANPLATQAACRVLRDGGTAADALVTAQAMLGLVEPQSSGIGGGGFLLYYDAATGTVEATDGREVAPAAATENYLRWISDADHTEPKPDVRLSGRSIGVPGIVRLLADVHARHGALPWRDLFDPAVTLADDGFDVSPRLAAAVADAVAQLSIDPDAAGYFLDENGEPKPAGTRLTNPAYAKTLGTIASDGPDAFYTGPIAENIVASVTDASADRTPGLMTLDDLARYTVKDREPLCTPYRGRQVCGMPPPSSGGLAVAATLGMLERFPMADHRPTAIDRNGGRPSVLGVHLMAEAQRLAYADRDRYVADTDFVSLPGGSPQALLDAAYLADRAETISLHHTMGTAAPGPFEAPLGVPAPVPEHGTSHISVVDAHGNAAALTTSIESAFGAFRMVDGFLLNNQLTDFAAEPVDEAGLPVANRVEPGKRPRSTMAPTLVFDPAPAGPPGTRGQLYAVLGSPGGAAIIQFMVKALVGLLDWGLDPQQAASLVAFGAANTPTTHVGGEHPDVDTTADGEHDPLVRGLRALGHHVDLADQSSGLGVLVRDRDGWAGGADPRREGLVAGDTR